MKRTVMALLLTAAVLIYAIPAAALDPCMEHSQSYMSGVYYQRLCAVELTGDGRTDIAAVALSQVGYHEGKSANDLSGDSTGKENYTEYGANFGNDPDAWCAMFVWWCARQAGVCESIIHKTEWAKIQTFDFETLALSQAQPRTGDIAFIDSSGSDGIEDHVGIIVAVTDSELSVVEGNCSNGVRLMTYSRQTGARSDGYTTLLAVGQPYYYGDNSDFVTYSTEFAVLTASTNRYEKAGGKVSGTLEQGEYLLLWSGQVDGEQWYQVAQGRSSYYVRGQVQLITRNLPPISAYATAEPQNTTTTRASASATTTTTASTQPVITTTQPTTLPTTDSTHTVNDQSPPDTSPLLTPDDGSQQSETEYSTVFELGWLVYGAFGLLVVLAVLLVIMMFSQKKNNSGY